MKIRQNSAAVLASCLIALGGCSPSTETNVGGEGVIPPVAVPLNEHSAPSAATPPAIAPSGNETDKRLAEEAMTVASAKALAFSREVQMYRERYYEALAKQFGNQAAQNNLLPQPGQYNRHRRRRTVLNPDGGLTSGDIAGEEYLRDEAKRLNNEAKEYLEKTDLAIQQESWRRMSEKDRSLVARFDLIPKEVRDAIKTSDSDLEPRDDTDVANNPPVLIWSPYPIPNTEFQIDFPSIVTKDVGDGLIRYSCTAGSVIFNVEWPREKLDAGRLSDEQILISETESIAEAQSQQGKSVARRIAKLGEYPAEELCVFYRLDRRELATYARFAMIDGKLVIVQINDVEANNEEHSQRFLNSFRRTTGGQK